MTSRPSAPGLVGGVLVVALAVAVILPSFGVLMPDTKPEIYLNPGRAFRDYLWPWQDNPGMGMPSFNVGLVPVSATVWLLEGLGAEPWLAARLLRLSLLLVAGLGAAALCRRLPGLAERRWSPLVAAVLFVACPYTISAGATLPVLLPLATLPWMALFLLEALRAPRPAGWTAAFGLAFAAGSGMNAGVVPLLQLSVIPGVVLLAHSAGLTSRRRTAVVLLQCAAWVIALSFYWLVPTVGARASGSTVLANTETLDGIFGPSSLAETIRGLGLWPLYGGDASGPWQPGLASYLTTVPVIVCSFLLLALALALGSRAPLAVRRGAGLLVVMVAVVMAGAFPPDNPSPLGRALVWLFETVPAAGAFRTTNKAGSVLALAVALLGAAGAASWIRSRRGRRRELMAGVACGAIIVGVAAAPLWNGGFYLGRYDVPSYWRQAAHALSGVPDNERVWMVPGQRLANYRWAAPSPDDVGRALVRPSSVVRTTVPNGSPEAANLLAAADEALGDPQTDAASIAVFARLLGAGTVLARHDLAYENSGGLPSAYVAGRLGGAPGLRLDQSFGRPGTNTSPAGEVPLGAGALPPLQAYDVERPGAILQARGTSGTILLAGDARAVPALVRAGLMDDAAPLSYLWGSTTGQVKQALEGGGRIVLTDTNRRSALDSQRLTSWNGPLLPASAAPRSSLALGSRADQTTLVVDGGSATAAAPAGDEAVPLGETAPENAFDDNPSTSWQFAPFEGATGHSVTRRFENPQDLDEVNVRVADLGPRQISRVRVEAGDVRREASVVAGTATVDLGGVVADQLRVTVLDATGSGANRLGIAEVRSAGGPLSRVARLPESSRRLANLDEQTLARAPIDVLLTRQQGAGGPNSDEESRLDRDLWLPGERNYFVSAMVRPGGSTTDSQFDTLAGFDDDVTVEGSSRAFNLPTLRGSQAMDGRGDTAWVPSSPEVGQTLTIRSEDSRTFTHLTVRQEGGPQAALENWVTRASVLVDGAKVAEGRLGRGEKTLRFDAIRGHEIQLRVEAVRHTTGTIRISEVASGSLEMTRASASSQPPCVPVMTVDGVPLLMRPTSPVVDGSSRPWVTCAGEGLPLAAGDHHLRGGSAWSVDSFHLRDSLGLEQKGQSASPALGDLRMSPTRFSARVPAAEAPYAVVLAQGWAPGWRASVDGRQLPGPQIVDGFSMAWVIEDFTRPHDIEITYGPRTAGLAALGVSAVAALLALVVAAKGLRGWRHARHAQGAPPVPPNRNRRHQPVQRWGPAAVVVLIGGLVGGWVGLALGLVCALLLRAGVRSRVLMVAAAGFVGVAPVLWLWGNRSRLGDVTPDLVSGNLLPHYSVMAALLLILVGLLASSAQETATEGKGQPERPLPRQGRTT